MSSTNRRPRREQFDDVVDSESRVKPNATQRKMQNKQSRMKIKAVLNKFNYDDFDTFVDEFEE